jgi:nicotinate-nucleotide pyrophosphorylase
MSVRLATTEPTPLIKERVIRMQADVLMLDKLKAAEIRAIYSELKGVLDALCTVLDKVDNQDV